MPRPSRKKSRLFFEKSNVRFFKKQPRFFQESSPLKNCINIQNGEKQCIMPPATKEWGKTTHPQSRLTFHTPPETLKKRKTANRSLAERPIMLIFARIKTHLLRAREIIVA
jgi:hypothetical protein